MNAAQFLAGSSAHGFGELVHILQSPGAPGALVMGRNGIGKSTLVEAAICAASVPAPALRVTCSQALADTPYGALSPFLGALAHVDEPVAVLREFNRFFHDQVNPPAPGIMVIEDAQHLDLHSGFVLSMLAENHVVKLVAVGAAQLDAGSPLAQLAAAAMLAPILVEPLDDEGVGTAAQELLGGRLSAGSAAIIRSLTGGIPRFVDEYVRSCREQGLLQRTGGRGPDPSGLEPQWVIEHPWPAVDARLAALIREVHKAIAGQERRTVEFLALAGAQHESCLAACQLPFSRSLAAGVLRQDSHGVVSLASKIHQHLLRLLVPAQADAALYRRWQEAGAGMPLEHTTGTIAWALRMGETLPVPKILDAALAAAADADAALAWSLCSMGQLSSRSMEAGILEVHLRLGSGRAAAARSQMLGLLPQAKDEQELHAWLVQVAMLAPFLGIAPRHMPAVLRQWQATLDSLASAEGARRLQGLKEHAASTVAMWNRVNDPHAALPPVQELEALARQGSIPPEFRIMCLAMLSDVLGMQGRCQSAVAAIQQATAMLPGAPPIPYAVVASLFFREVWQLAFHGDFAQAQQLATAFGAAQRTPGIGHHGVIALATGLLHLQQGRTAAAVDALAQSVHELAVQDPARLRPTAANLYLVARRRLARQVYAQPADVPEPVGVPEPPLERGHRQPGSSSRCLYAAATAAAVAGRNLARFPLMQQEASFEACCDLEDGELQAVAAMVLGEHDPARSENPRGQLIAELLALRIGGRAKALEALALDAVQHGRYPIAVEAMARAAVRHSRSGDPRSCGRLLRQVAWILRAQGMTPSRFVSQALSLCELTVRETEIVAHARAGRTNGQIAELLTVSPRTVEGHLYRIFSKLGISNRAELHGYEPRSYSQGYG